MNILRRTLSIIMIALLSFGQTVPVLATQVSAQVAGTHDVCSSTCDFTTIQGAIDAANAGDTITLGEDISTGVQVYVNKSITLNGNGHRLSPSFTKTDNSNNSAIGVSSPDVTIQNLIIDGAGGTNLHGINVYVSTNVNLTGVTISNGFRAALNVNGSTVTATNLNTSGNLWGAVNVDPGVGVITPSVFTLNGGTLGENTQIWSDGANVTAGDPVVTVNATGYTKYLVGGTVDTYIWSNRALSQAAVISKDGVNTIYTTIQDAITAALAGDTITVGSGNYAEQITIDKVISLNGSGSGADSSSNTIISGSGTGTGITASTGTDTSTRVQISNLRVTGFVTGVAVNSYTTITNVASISNTTYGINLGELQDLVISSSKFNSNSVGLKIPSTVSVSNVTISNSEFDSNSQHGWYSDKGSSSSSNITNLSVTDTSFSNNTNKGFYTEKLTYSTFNRVTVNASGTGGSLNHRAGFDINLKYGSYQNIQIQNSTFTNNGIGDPNGGGLLVKARSTGSYAVNPATLNNVTLSNLIVNGNGGDTYGAGIRIGESNNSLTGADSGPTNVTVTGSSFSENSVHALRNATTTQVAAINNWWGDAAGAGSNVSGDATTAPWYINAGRTILSTEVSTEEPEKITPPDDLELPSDTPGEATLPSGTDTIVFSPDKVIDLANNTETVNVSDPVVVTPPVIGGQTVIVDKQVELTSGTGNAITIQNSATPEITLEIPNNTTIYAPAAWDGTITPPTTTTTTGSAPSGFSFGGTALKVGSDVATLVFDQAVTLLLEGVNSPVGYQAAGSSTWNLIAQCDGTFATPTDPGFPGECSITNGTDTKILTYHFTTFAALNQDPAPTPTPTPTPTPSTTSSNQSNATPAQLAVAETVTPEGTVAAEQDNRDISSTQTDTPNQTDDDAQETNGLTVWFWLLLGAVVIGVVYYAIVRRKR